MGIFLASFQAYRNRMNSVAAKENLLKQVVGFPLNVFLTRFFYQAANSFADNKIPNRLTTIISSSDSDHLGRIQVFAAAVFIVASFHGTPAE